MVLQVGGTPAIARADSTAALHLSLNIPAFRLDVYDGPTLLTSYPVAVGLPEFPTPTGDFGISRIEWNPWWIPPEREWAQSEKPTPPNPTNPMGRVKLYFRTYYFVHGTPFDSSVGRAASHGCVRLSNRDAVQLAKEVMRRGAMDLSPAELDEIALDTAGTRAIVLTREIPLHITYDLAEVRDSVLVLHPDLYRRASREAVRAFVIDVLRRAGATPTGLDEPRLDSLLRRSAQARLSIPLDSVLARR